MLQHVKSALRNNHSTEKAVVALHKDISQKGKFKISYRTGKFLFHGLQ